MNDIADRAGDNVLGVLLAYYTPELLTRVQSTGIERGDFPREQQEAVYRAILNLHGRGDHVDALTVEAFLFEHGWLERVGGVAFLDLCTHAMSPSAVVDHARLVAKKGNQRRLIAASEHLNVKAREWDDQEGLIEAAAAVAREVRTYIAARSETRLRVVKEQAA